MRPLTYGLCMHAHFKIDGVAEDRYLGVEPAWKGWFVLAARRLPQIVSANKVLGADLRPHAPDEWFIKPDDGNKNPSAQVKIFAVDDALVRCDDHPLLELFQRNRRHRLRSFDTILHRQNIVMLPADAAIESCMQLTTHALILPQSDEQLG